MKTELLTFTAANGTCVMTAPHGFENRLVAALILCDSCTPLDQALIDFFRGADEMIGAPASGLNAATTAVSFAIGLQNLEALQATITPATGVIVFTQNSLQCAALPDIWWPFDITLQSSVGNGNRNSTTFIYEQRARR